jgi:hypothetical protein
VQFPTSGVLPFKGMVLYVAPLCYLYEEAEDVYFLFRELYVRHFCRLHSIDSRRGSLVALCRLFESLVQARDADVCFRCVFAAQFLPLA